MQGKLLGKLALVAALSGLTAQVQAGEVLRFAKGNVDLRQQSLLISNEADEQIWVVQFQQKISAADQKALKQTGAKVYRYIPDDAYVVRGSRQKISSALNGRLTGMMPYRGEFKLSDNLPTISVFSTNQNDIYSLTVVANDEVTAVLADLQKIDPTVQVLQQEGRFLDIRLNRSAVPTASRIGGVEFIEARPEIVTLHMVLDESEEPSAKANGDYKDLNGYETGTKVMNFEAAWTAGFAGEGQSVSIADTGLDRGDDSLLSDEFKGTIVKAYSVGIGAKSWADPMGHGTHVAGSVAGRGTASGLKLQGGAFKARLVPQGMWSPLLDNLTVPPKLANLFAPAYEDGARVHTNSWGAAANFGAYDSMAQQADEFLWNNDRMIILFAAGNSGTDKNADGVIDHGSIGTPGTAKNVLTVGASENLLAVGGIQKSVSELKPAKDNWSAEPIWSSKLSDNPNGIACFSSRGPTRDGRLKPEIVAPGTNILSAKSQEPGAQALWGEYNSSYVYSGGTSMATPLTAGAAAVVREVLIKRHKIADPSGALVKAVLLHTAVDLFPGQYGTGPQQELTPRPNNDEGYGRADLANVMGLGKDTHFVDSAGVATGETQEFEIKVPAGKKLLANLVYFDAPGSPSAAKALVNNLDLALVAPGGAETASLDETNNNEIIEATGLTKGTYKLVVRGSNVPMGKAGKQPFALVYTIQ